MRPVDMWFFCRIYAGDFLMMIDKNHKIWTEHPDNHSVKAVISGLRLYRSDWKKTSAYEEAALWCIASDTDDVDSIYKNYQSIPSPKPEVIFLASAFKPMMDSHWVFFKTPINVRIFHKWLSSKGFQSEHSVLSSVAADDVSVARWRKEQFKMSRWPNVTQYSNSPNLIVMCSMIMHDWCDYSKLIPLNIEEEVLERVLNDAEKDGNLIFRKKSSQADAEAAQAIKDEVNKKSRKRKSKGLFRKLFEKFTQ